MKVELTVTAAWLLWAGVKLSLAWVVPTKTKTWRHGSRSRSQVDATTTCEESDAAVTRQFWKEKVQALAFRTMCGFKATPTDRQRMKYLLEQKLAPHSPKGEPAAAYYQDDNETMTSAPSLEGKWTLLYTDAPDILSLADSDTFARVQRIGQECDGTAGTIANVIEWIPPVWAGALPTSVTGNAQQPRILQRVVTQASASPAAPRKVKLLLQGLQVEWVVSEDGDNDKEDKDDALLSRFWRSVDNNLRLQGPLTLPFGSFEILYLDDDLRVIRTSQGYYAVNRRNAPDTEWF